MVHAYVHSPIVSSAIVSGTSGLDGLQVSNIT
jgi:hypothetical protein